MAGVAAEEVVAQAIATYREKIIGLVDRRFVLLPDRVVVSGWSHPNTRFEAPVLLETLSPDYHRVWLMSRHATWSKYAGCLLIPICAVVVLEAGRLLPVLIAGIGLALFVMTYVAWSRRLIEYACFMNTAGIKSLDFGCTGPERHRFQDFVDSVRKQIEKARRESDGSSKSAFTSSIEVSEVRCIDREIELVLANGTCQKIALSEIARLEMSADGTPRSLVVRKNS